MAAPCRKVQVFGSVLSKYLRGSVFQHAQTLPSASACLVQVRHRSKKRPRVREAKVQVETNKRYNIKEKKTLIDESTVKESTILADTPVDNVWLRKYYPTPKFSIEETIERHKAFAQPAMLDNMEGLLYMDMRLDFTTKKQTKFLQNIRQTLLLPNEFPYGEPPSILVFCKTEENLNTASSLGAKTFGTPAEIIKQIENGVINLKDYTHVLCTPDCSNDILTLRSHLRERFPQKAKGNLNFDVKEMWNLFYNGYTYESTKITDAQGRLQVPFGIMAQPTEDIVGNFNTYITSICQHRSIALGPFIQSIKVIAPPSPEEFLVKVEDYVPGYKNEEIDSDDEAEAEAAGE